MWINNRCITVSDKAGAITATNSLTLQPGGTADTINGASSAITEYLAHASVTLCSDLTSNWDVIGSNVCHVPWSGGSGGGTLSASANNMFPLGYLASPSTSDTPFQQIVGQAGVFHNLSVALQADPGSTKSYAISLRTAASYAAAAGTSALSATVTGNGTNGVSASDTTHAVALAANGAVNMLSVPTGTPTAEQARVTAILDTPCDY
jgi:hypothetical protein